MGSRDNVVFVTAREKFVSALDRLPQVHKDLFATCRSSKDLVEELGALQEMHKSRRTKTICTRILKASERFKNYFAALDVFTQCDPIHAGTIWGGIRVVVELASNFAAFFDKLGAILFRLGSLLPVYDKLADMYKDDASELSPHIIHIVEGVYTDVLEFFHTILRVFYNIDGRSKGTLRLFTTMIWKPFDLCSQDIFERMNVRENIVNLELSLQGIKYARSQEENMERERLRSDIERESAEFERQESEKGRWTTNATKQLLTQEVQETTFHRVRSWLSPSAFKSKYEWSQDLREEGTGHWLSDQENYKSWRNACDEDVEPPLIESFGSNVLWVHGKPGCGKTVLAAATVEELRDDVSMDSTVCYFFFESRLSTLEDSTAAYRSILSQILQKHRSNKDILDIFSYGMYNLSDGQATASRDELIEALLLCCKRIGRTFIILDGLDECRDYESLIPKLHELSAIQSVRSLIFSRPTVVSLRKRVLSSMHQAVNFLNSADIKLYLGNKMEGLVKNGMLSRQSNIHAVVNRLLRRAEGLFLWVRLLITYIESPALTLMQRESALEETSLPDGLEGMYDKILEMIWNQGQASRKLAKHVFLWLIWARRELSSNELECTLLGSSCTSQAMHKDRYNDFESTVIVTCAGLVECGVTDNQSSFGERSFRFIHASVREYLTCDKSPDTDKTYHASTIAMKGLGTREQEAHAEIAMSCLLYLLHELPAQPLSGRLGVDPSKEDVNNAFPLCEYAASNWPFHLSATDIERSSPTRNSEDETQDFEELLAAISTFLHQPLVLMAWIEASYLQGSPPELEPLERWINAILQQKQHLPRIQSRRHTLAAEIVQFVGYLRKLRSDWGTSLTSNPGCIWEEITAFNPSPFLSQNSGIGFRSLVSRNTLNPVQSSKEIMKVSVTTSGGTAVVTLSIWPSRNFEVFYNSGRTQSTWSQDVYRLTSDWTAKYEVYVIKTHTRVLSVSIDLDPAEVAIQIRQSLWQTSSKSWNIQFPVALSFEGTYFTILRSLYTLTYCSETSTIYRYVATLPLELNSSNRQYWRTVDEEDQEERNSFKYVRVDEVHERSRSKPIYLYWIFFDEREPRLCFVDRVRCVPNNIMVFNLTRPEKSHSNPFVQILGNTQKLLRSLDSSEYNYEHDAQDFRICFHPALAILALGSLNGLYLWNFSSVKKETPRIVTWRSKILPQRLEFSACGNYVVVSRISRTPDVIDITSWLDSSRQNPGDRSTTTKPQPEQQHHLLCEQSLRTNSTTPGALIPLVNHSDTLLRSSRYLTDINGSFNEIRIINDNGNVIKIDGRPLAFLPDWQEVECITADVIPPSVKENIVTVILNKTAKDWNNLSSLSSREDLHFPGIIERDVRTLRPQTRGTLALASSSSNASPTFGIP